MPPLGPFLTHQFAQLPCITTPSPIQGEEDSQKPPMKTKDDEQTLSRAAPDALRDNNDLTLMSRGELTYSINELACGLEKASRFCPQVTNSMFEVSVQTIHPQDCPRPCMEGNQQLLCGLLSL